MGTLRKLNACVSVVAAIQYQTQGSHVVDPWGDGAIPGSGV